MRRVFYLFATVGLSSCGYHYSAQEGDSSRSYCLTVPYIPGDSDAALNNELVYQLSASGHFRCVRSGGDYILRSKIISDTKSRIGFRYDRDNSTGAIEKNLLGVEDRRAVTAEVSLLDTRTGNIVAGPFEVSSNVDYDYIDPGSPKDLLFKNRPIIQFSVGQLDSYEGAYDDTARLIFRKLAEKITAGLVNHLVDGQ